MRTYDAVKDRILFLLEEKKTSIHKLAIDSAVAPSTIKNILYGKSYSNDKNAMRRFWNFTCRIF